MLIQQAIFFIHCQVMFTDGGSRSSLKKFRTCLGMPSNKPASKRAILNYIRRNFAIIPLSHSPSPQDINASSSVPRRVPRTLAPGRYCPYTIKSEDVLNRIPRFLAYASCREEICNPVLCKPVMYSHKVLIQKCDGVWEWSEKTLPVAFVQAV